jgi:BirA family biotin operon repressor/biotin-[acetyl-CoA-carboxylase] ligase
VKIYHFETLVSTQDTTKQYLADGRDLPFAVYADMQTNGRGRSGNKWVSQHGNLLASIAIPLENIPVKEAGQYSFLTAVTLMNCLADYGVINAQNKWPNDILVDGKKIAGILLESDISVDGLINALIIGIGVNLVSAPESSICIKSLIGEEISSLTFLNQFINQLEIQLNSIKQNGFAPIRNNWLSKAFGMGEVIRVRLPNEVFFGDFMGLDEEGALLVNVDGRTRKVYSGDVFFEGKS